MFSGLDGFALARQVKTTQTITSQPWPMISPGMLSRVVSRSLLLESVDSCAFISLTGPKLQVSLGADMQNLQNVDACEHASICSPVCTCRNTHLSLQMHVGVYRWNYDYMHACMRTRAHMHSFTCFLCLCVCIAVNILYIPLCTCPHM